MGNFFSKGFNIYKRIKRNYKYICIYIHSNVLIAPCSTADPGIAGAVLIQNKPNTETERLIILD